MVRFEEAVQKLVDQYIPIMTVEKFKDEAKKAAADELKAEAYKRIIENNGYIDPSLKGLDEEVGYIPFKDLITSPEFKNLFPKVVRKIALDVMEPALILTPLFERVNIKGPVLTVRIPQIVLNTGADLDIGEGAEPPEITLNAGGAFMDVTVGKSGVAVAISAEAIQASQYNILDMALKAAAQALARHKERKAANHMLEWAGDWVVLDADSSDPNMQLSGVDASGNYNKGLALDDLIRAGMKFLEKGFVLDTLIMHPLAFEAFMTNGTLRRLFYESAGAAGQFVQWPKTKGGQPQSLATLGSVINLQGYNITGFGVPGAKIIGRSLKVILTPYAPIDTANKKFDIIVADSAAVGYYLVEQEPTTTRLKDDWRDVLKVKIIEKYAFAPKFGGEGLGVIKNVAITKSYDLQIVKSV